jgi:hypothetical protein
VSDEIVRQTFGQSNKSQKQSSPASEVSTGNTGKRRATAEGAEPGNDIETEKAKRRKLLTEYKAECKLSGKHVNYRQIATDVNRRWNSRAQIDKWLACDPRYWGETDRLMREFLTREIRRLREARLYKPHP